MKVSELRDLLEYAGDDDEVIVIKDDSYFHLMRGPRAQTSGPSTFKRGNPPNFKETG